ncbi:aromatase/cyclase [Nocardiopsis halotolerans]|uniref:aromatase/cyclase n=1 Tax=Nocardiopsis halotolerans TaxID=124252 RepID=UPI00034CDA55|nr:aromatase/cyclase [Nocardiopsis halotolerans]
MTPPPHTTRHHRTIQAPAELVYSLVADATRWPAVFEPSVALRHIERSEEEERFRIWAMVNGTVSTWTSHRTLESDALRVTFRQERARPPVTSMTGSWTVRPLAPGRSEVELRHDFTLEAGPEGSHEGFLTAVDRNSVRELDALARVAELEGSLDDVLFTFTDTVRVQAPAESVYAFVARADSWPERLPHVLKVSLREEPPGIQELEMETATSDGSSHVTRSYRVCEASSWIAYKQVVLPELLHGHSGVWSFQDEADGASTAHSQHTVLLNPEAVGRVLGPDTTLAQARDRVRDLLGANSRTTLERAAEHASRGVPSSARSRS